MGRGDLFVVSAPSGAGKTTLCLRLMAELSGISFSVSYTTRRARAGEIEGRDYCFVSRERFDEMIAVGAFLEWASVHGNYYGTSREQVLGLLDQGLDVLLDIDVQGARQVRKLLPYAHLIFVLPPSLPVLRQRLLRRRSEDEAELEMRLAKARDEMQAVSDYDFVVVNDDLDEASAAMGAIVLAVRCRTPRGLDRPGLMQGLGLA